MRNVPSKLSFINIPSKLSSSPSRLSTRGTPIVRNRYIANRNGIFFKPTVPHLPLIDEMVSIAQRHPIDLSHTVFIGVQHMLETTVTLFDGLIKLGVKPHNMFFTGKCYSSSSIIEEEVRNRGIHLVPATIPYKPGHFQDSFRAQVIQMWSICVDKIRRRGIDRVIILDDGGRCLENMPQFMRYEFPIAGIEQTRGGLYNHVLETLPFPLVEVATSVVKKELEAPRIAEAVLRKVKQILPELKLDSDAVCGVIGNGAIGNAVAKYLLSKNYKVTVFDENDGSFNFVNKNLYRLHSARDVIAGSRYIFGCTGKDVTEGIDVFSLAKSDQVFISCTSEDKEFLSLLKDISNRSPLFIGDLMSTFTCQGDTNTKITMISGGFPINFDRKPWNVPAKDIAVTQALLLGGCLQAITCATKPKDDGRTINVPSRQLLDPFLQRFVVDRWIKTQPADRYNKNHLDCFNNIEWVIKNSGGTYYQNKFLSDCFGKLEAPKEPKSTISR